MGKGTGRVPVQTDMPPTIPQHEARRYLPPGTHIWRGLTRGERCGHCPPRAHIESGAMWLCIQALWKQYLRRALPLTRG
eukprot:10865499-Prorocentrum_lima.AAC.1